MSQSPETIAQQTSIDGTLFVAAVFTLGCVIWFLVARRQAQLEDARARQDAERAAKRRAAMDAGINAGLAVGYPVTRDVHAEFTQQLDELARRREANANTANVIPIRGGGTYRQGPAA